MNDELNQAYSLIKQGQKQAAIALIEPVIRADRDNEDAWWLLANATSDDSAKKNALSNVLRLTRNDNRKFKAQSILDKMNDDPFGFDDAVSAPPQRKMSSYQELDEAPRKKSGGMGCGKIALIFIGIIGVCACIAGFGIYSVFGEVFDYATIPENYVDEGLLKDGETYEGEVVDGADPNAYRFSGDAGERVTISVVSEGDSAPIIAVYDVSAGTIVNFEFDSTDNEGSLSFDLPTSGDYLVVLRGITLWSVEFGYGDYELEFSD